jgi:hypothetical protein
MLKRFSAIVLAGGAAAALTIGLGTTSSFATTAAKTWTVTPGGTITGKATNVKLTDTASNTVLTCKTSGAGGTAKSGSGQKGTDLVPITSSTFTTCSGPLSLTFTVTTSASTSNPWELSATTYASGVTHGTLTNIKATLSGTGCSATVGGTTATATGSVKGTYTNSTGKLKILPTGGTLHIWNVSGCFGLLTNGDASSFVGTYTITPKQTITSP